MEVLSYDETMARQWDDLCQKSSNATFLHTRKFLSYHGSRFADESIVITEAGKMIAVFPAARDLCNEQTVVSHPGITYGGLLHGGFLRGERMISALSDIFSYYAYAGYQRLVYKAVPSFYHKTPSQDDLYGLFRLGVPCIRCDLSATIDLNNRILASQRRRRSLKKAARVGIEVREGSSYLPSLWEVLVENLLKKHNVAPVHTLQEITSLISLFPQNIRCICGLFQCEVVAGVIIFGTQMADHAQYISSSSLGYETSALDSVFEYCIECATREGKRWFDFGISTEDAGMFLNETLYSFKCEFGAGGWIHEFFEVDLHGRV